MFDITVIEPLSLIQVLTNLIRLYNGSLYKHSRVSHYRSASLTITATEPSLVEVDGEVAGMLPAQFKILPRALRVVVP